MEGLGVLVKQRVEQIIVDSEMLRAGFAALPYLVLRDTKLSLGARLAYAILLMYAWQKESCFPGQTRMAQDLGTSERNLRRYLQDLRLRRYISWRRTNGTNEYRITDVKSKLKHLVSQVDQQIIFVENAVLRAGFAALPYVVLRDKKLSIGARLAYAILLMYAWQEGSCFPGQVRMATDLGASERNLRRYLYELRDCRYVSWHRTNKSNEYRILDVKSKLKRRKLSP
jgi:AraC-like DNA-binding protein